MPHTALEPDSKVTKVKIDKKYPIDVYQFFMATSETDKHELIVSRQAVDGCSVIREADSQSMAKAFVLIRGNLFQAEMLHSTLSALKSQFHIGEEP